MKELNLTEIKNFQLKILEEVASFCEKNNIRYSLYFGTLLGAVRHQGYIPWDDDIDIMMPRPDYNRFIKSFETTDNNLRIKSLLNDDNYPYTFAKVENIKTKLIEYADITYDIGVNIDIFPIDGVPEEQNIFDKFFKSLILQRDFLLIKTVKTDFKNRSAFKNLILLFMKLIFKVVSYKTIIKSINKKITKNGFVESKYVMACCFPGIKKHQKLRRVIYEEFIDIDFESKKYKVIKHYDDYLKMQYGNYMELPPVNEQVTHHSFTAYLK
jgi:lipopolysaccharide cholinephosphotransferase